MTKLSADRVGEPSAVTEVALTPTPMQVAMVFASVREPAAGNYIQQLRIRFREPTKSADWRNAFEMVAGRHGILRARFDLLKENGPQVRIESAAPIPFRERDLSGESPEEREGIVRDYLTEDQRTGFQTDQAPLMRLAWFTRGEKDHELIWTSHHALFDGRGRYLILREVNEIHDALASGRPAELPEPADYRQFLDWMAASDPADDEAFWKSKLAGMEEPPPLGVAGPGPSPVDSHDRQALRQSLGHGLGEQLEAFAKSTGVTVNTLVQAAWALVLWRQTGRDEVVFGAPRACRHGSVPKAGEMVGVMVNTVPVRVRMDRKTGVLTLLKQLRDLWVEMRPHEHAPVTLMRRAAGLGQGVPLFESLVGFEGYELTDRLRQDDPRWINREAVLEARTELPLTLQLYRSEIWDLVLTYDPERFPGRTAEWFAERFRTALGALVRSADLTIDDIPVVGPSEAEQLHSWGVREGPYPDDETVHGRFSKVARENRDREALVFGEDVWTYGDLEERSNCLADSLYRDFKVDGQLVAVIGPRCPEQIMAIIAILKAGGGYLPLDPEFPDERLRLLIEESGAVCLVACGGWNDAGRNLGIPGCEAHSGFARSSSSPSSSAGPESPAYVMFTSGSTGRPKGVEVPHRGIMRLLFGIDYVDLGPERSLIHLSPAAFDASTFEIWGSLLHGGRCILYPERVPTPDQLAEIICRYEVDTLWLTCSLFNFMVDEAPEVLRPIRQLLTGGEALSRDHVERALRHLPETRLINCYGPTEATTFTTTHEVPRSYQASQGPVSIGGPISNTTVLVVDESDRLVPIGCEGELLIGGPGVALGYRRRPDLTGERFVRVSGFPDTVFYRTGDRVHWQLDGTLGFVGREDDQVKIRGFRIELGEVESELKKIPGIRRASVILLNQAPRGKVLAAAVVLSGGIETTVDGMRRQLASRVPDFMVPSVIRILRELPLNANGKIDRRKLEEVLSSPEAVVDSSPPGSHGDDVRNSVLVLLRETLALDRIDEAKSFFELGGDSLAAIRFLTRTSSVLGTKIPFSVVFGERSVAETVNRIAGIQSLDHTSESVSPVRIERGGRIPLTSKQRSYLEISQRNPDHPTGVIGRAFRIRGTVRRSLFSKAVEWLIQRHEPLRTIFEMDPSGEVGQRILPTLPAALEFSSLPAPVLHPDEWILGELDRQVAEGLNPFDGPLIRFRLINSNRRSGALLVTSLHLVTDGSSLAIVLEDLFRAYGCLLAGVEPDLPPLQLQYLDFQGWHAQMLDGPTMDSLREFWSRQVGSLPIPHFKVLHGDRGGDHCHGRMRYLSTDSDLTARIREYSDRRGVTPFVSCLAAFKIVLSRYAGMTDLSIGTSINLKEHPDFDGAIGDFSNLLPIRTRLSPGESIDGLCGRIIESFSATMSHRFFPKMEVRKMVPRAPSIFDDAYCPFSFTEVPPFALNLPSGLALEPLNRKERDFFFVFQGNLEERPDSLEFRFTYATKIFSEAVMDAFVADFTMVLEHLVADPGRTMSELPWNEGNPPELVEVEEPIKQFVQTAVLARLREFLRVDAVDTKRSFVGLGGDSILALRLAATLADDLSIGVPPSLFLTGRPISEVVSELSGTGHHASSASKFDLVGVDRFRLWPLAPKQETYLAAIREHPGEPINILGRAFRVKGRLDAKALEKALNFVIGRHEPLRTLLVRSKGGSLAQKILPELPAELEWQSTANADLTEDRVLDDLTSFVRAGLDAFRGPILRLKVLSDGSKRHVILLKVLHIAVDGAWLPDLVGDLAEAYNAYVEDREPQMVPPVLQYIDFQVWHRRILEADTGKRIESFWRKELDGVPTLRFPGFPENAAIEFPFKGRIRYFEFPVELAALVRERSIAAGITPFNLAFATHVGLLRLYSDQTDFTVGTSLNLKEDARLDGAVGDFSNPIQIRFRLARNLTLHALLGSVTSAICGTLDHRHFPSASVRKLIPDGGSVLGDPVNGFSFREMRDLCERMRITGAEITQIEATSRLLELIMSTNFVDSDDRMRLRVTYSPEVLREEVVECFYSDFFRLIGQIADGSDEPLDSFKPSWPKAAILRRERAAPDSGSRRAVVLNALRELLRIDEVDTTLGFLNLGGDSLQALRLSSRLTRELGINVPPSLILSGLSVDRVIDVLERGEIQPSPPVRVELELVDRSRPLPIGPKQQDYLECRKQDPDKPVGVLARAFLIEGPLNGEALQTAIDWVVRRHEPLRTILKESAQGGAVQEVLPDLPSVLQWIAATAGETEPEAIVRSLELFTHEQVDPGRGPILQLRVLETGPERHALLMRVLHIAVDGALLPELLGDLAEAYNAALEGRSPDRPPIALQFLDYQVWLGRLLQSNAREFLESFWRRYLDGVSPVKFPGFPKAMPGFRVSQARIRYVDFPVELAERVRSGAQNLGTTTFNLAFAAYVGLLKLYSGQNDLVVISAINLREDSRFDGAIGDFSTSTLVRLRLDDPVTLEGLKAEVLRSLGSVLDHRFYPMSAVRKLVPKGGSSLDDPLFGFAFIEMHDICEHFGLSGSRVRLIEAQRRVLPGVMSTNFLDTGKAMRLRITYAPEFLSEETIEFLVADFLELIERIIISPEDSLDSFKPSWPDAFANRTDVSPAGRPHGLVKEVTSLYEAILRSDRIRATESFFDLGGDSVSALRVIQHIRRGYGVELDYLTFTRNSSPVEIARVIYRMRRTGPVSDYGPIEKVEPRGPIIHPREQAEIQREALRKRGNRGGGIARAFRVKGRVDLDAFEQALRFVVDRHDNLRMRMEMLPDGRMAQLYPAEVEVTLQREDLSSIEPASVDERVELLYREECLTPMDYPFGAGYRFRAIRLPSEETLLLLTFTHAHTDGISLVRVFSEISRAYEAFASGRQPDLPPVRLQALDFQRWLEVWRKGNRERLERYWQGVYAEGIPAAQLPFEHSGDSETIYLGHYLYLNLPDDLMQAVRRLAREVGTSAYFILLSSFLILLNRLTGMRRPIVGFVSDARIHPDADGVVGNFVNSVPLMHSFDDDDRLINAICDCVKSASDGIAHAGIPVATLLDIEGEDAASLGGRFASASFNQVPDTLGVLRLGSLPIEPLRRSYIWRKNTIVALVSDKDDGSATVQFSYPTELMSENRARVFLNHFRILLQTVVEEPECRLADIINPFGKPASSDEEKKVIALFEEVLGRSVRRDESFFESGGDSLSALRLLQKIKAVLRVPLTYAEIFEHASPCDLAAHLEEMGRRRSDEGENGLPSVERLDRNHRWPATDNQKVYWRLITEGKGKVTGNIVRPMRVRGRLRCAHLRKALKFVIDRHEALRTGLVTDDKGDVVQRIVTRFRVPFVFESKPGLSEKQRSAFCLKRAELEGKIPFDLGRPPLIRATVVRFAPEEFFLVLTLNHAVGDGTSLGIIWSDLALAYRCVAEGRDFPLKPLPCQYLDMSRWQQQFLRDRNEARLESFWKDNLAGMVPGIRFPLDGALGPKRSRPGFILHHRFGRELTESLRGLCLTHGLSLFCLSLASFKLALRAFTGAGDIAVSSAVDCREHPEAGQIVGHFANRVIIRTRIDPERTAVDFLKTVKANLAAAMDHRQFPSARAFAMVPKDEDGRAEPDDFVFNQGPKAGRDLDLVGTRISPVIRQKARPNGVLGMTWRDFDADGMEVQLFYAKALFKKTSIEHFFSVWTRVLQELVADPLILIGDLPSAADLGGSSPEPAKAGVALDRITVEGESGAGLANRESVTRVVAEILGLGEVDCRRSLFDLGGDSVTVLRLLARLRRDFAIELHFQDVALSCDLDELVSLILSRASGDIVTAPVPILTDRRPRLITGNAAENWRRINAESNRFPYTITRAFELNGPFDVAAFRRAWISVIDRHEALRMIHCCNDDGSVSQVVQKQFDAAMDVVNLSDRCIDDAVGQARQIFHEESVRPFALTEELPLRCRIIRITDGRDVVIMTFYHGLIDGIGLGVVFDELSHAYHAFLKNREPVLPPGRVQALDYWSWLESWVDANRERLETHWKAVFLQGVPEIRLPWNRSRPPGKVLPGLMSELELPAELMSGVALRAGYHGISRFRYLLAAAFVMFARNRSADVRVISTIFNARRHPDAERVVGPFVEAVPIMIPSLHGMPVHAAVDRVVQQSNESLSHAWSGIIPLGMGMLKESGRTDTPFNTVFFSQLPDLESPFKMEGSNVESWKRTEIQMLGSLGMSAGERTDGSFVVRLSAPQVLVSAEEAKVFLEGFRDTVSWMVQNSTAEVSPEALAVPAALPSAAGDGDDPTLHRVVGIYEGVLGRKIDADTAFLSAGGDSLKAASVMHRVNREFGMNLPFSVFEEASTIRQLATAIRSSKARRGSREIVARMERNEALEHPPLVILPRPIPRELMPEPPPGTIRPDYGARYLICRGFEVGAGFDLGLFERAFLHVVGRHEALRRCFRRDRSGRVWAVVRQDPKMCLEVEDLGGVLGSEADRRIAEIYDTESRRPLRPFSGVMHRVKAVRVGSGRTALIFTFTHRYLDGLSVVKVLSEVAEAYRTIAGGGVPDLPAVHLHEPDYQAWLGQWEEANRVRLETFWRKTFGGGFPPRAFPAAKPLKRRGKPIHGRFLNFTIEAREVDRIRTFALARKSTPHYVFLSAAYVFVNRWFGIEDILATSAVDMRMPPEAKDVVGNFVSNLPARVRFSEDFDLGQVVDEVTRVGRESTANRTFNAGLILKSMLDEAGQTENPLGCFYFNQVPDTYGAFRLGEIPVKPLLRTAVGGGSFSLSIRYQEDGSVGFQVSVPVKIVSPDAFEPQLEVYRTILKTLVSSPETRVGDLKKLVWDTNQ